MLKITGTDGKEYGPIPVETLKQWITEGRVNAQTKVLPDGATEWQTLAGIPELAAALPIAAPPAPLAATGVAPATDVVNGPGIGLIVTGAIYLLLACFRFIGTLAGFGFAAANRMGNPELDRIFAIAG